MKNRRIFLWFLAVIMVLSLATAMTVVAAAEDDDGKHETETGTDYESDFVIRYEGESVFGYEGESVVFNVGDGEIVYETNVVWMWVCDCGKANMGESCSECGAERPENFLGGAYVVHGSAEKDDSTAQEKVGDLLGCSGVISVGSVVAVVALAGVCLTKRKQSDD